MSGKVDYVKEYFASWKEDLQRTNQLLSQQTYYLEGILVLSCHVGALGSLRFPTLQDNEAYKRVVLEYSGKRGFYEQIDLLFFLQWPRSELRTHPSYGSLKNHADIAKIVQDKFGDEEHIKAVPERYIERQAFLDLVSVKPFVGFDKKNLEGHLPLFSLCEQLYRYLRCHAVHNLHFPFVNRVHVMGNAIRYDDNHAITGKILYETVNTILENLEQECVKAGKWPWDL